MTPAAIIDQATADGLTLSLSAGESIKVAGAADAVQRWVGQIRDHKPEILAALKSRQASNDPPPYDATEAVREAVTERDAIMWEAGVPDWRRTEVLEAAERFYSHLFGIAKEIGCCHAPTGRYCAEGERLRSVYYGRCQ